MNTDTHFDLVILGGGPAGSRAAFLGAAAGMKTALIEAGFLGGTCLNAGCIPTKYLLGGTASLPLLAAQAKYNVARGETRINFAALQERKERYIKGTRQALEKRLTEAGISVFHGKGAFTGPQSLHVKGASGDTELSFGKCLVATGSVPASFPGLKPDGASVHASAGILNLKEVPESLLIVGGGAIGIELGELFHRLGSKIIMVEVAPRILPGEDPDISLAMHTHFTREGWKIHIGRRIAGLETAEGRSVLRFEDAEELTAAASLICVGRRPATAGLSPESALLNVQPNGWLKTDEFLRTADNVYAVGDVNGRTLLAHAADHQARYAVEHAAGRTSAAYQPPAMPSCVYGTMEVMRVGPTLAQLQNDGGEIKISRAPMAANAIAQSYGHTQGFVKMTWKNNELFAVCAVGHGVSHMVTAAALLVHERVQKNSHSSIIFAHPTLDEVLESAMVSSLEDIG